jgi:hypothetical protein
MHRCITERSDQTVKKLISSSFSWLWLSSSSSLPFYSPLDILKFAPAMLVERVCSHPV